MDYIKPELFSGKNKEQLIKLYEGIKHVKKNKN